VSIPLLRFPGDARAHDLPSTAAPAAAAGRRGRRRESAVKALEKNGTSLHGEEISVTLERAQPPLRSAMPDPMVALGMRPVAGLPGLPHSIYDRLPQVSRRCRRGDRPHSNRDWASFQIASGGKKARFVGLVQIWQFPPALGAISRRIGANCAIQPTVLGATLPPPPKATGGAGWIPRA
jgi:hypothetical protein